MTLMIATGKVIQTMIIPKKTLIMKGKMTIPMRIKGFCIEMSIPVRIAKGNIWMKNSFIETTVEGATEKTVLTLMFNIILFDLETPGCIKFENKIIFTNDI